jgi:hypothetical protein
MLHPAAHLQAAFPVGSLSRDARHDAEGSRLALIVIHEAHHQLHPAGSANENPAPAYLRIDDRFAL